MIILVTSILASWSAQRFTRQQKRKDAADGRREDHEHDGEKYRKTGNFENLHPCHAISSLDPFKGKYSFQGDIAAWKAWKAWEAPIPEISNL